MITLFNKDIPTNPGVYLMKKNNKVIYVGKAKNLANRVSSYFTKEHEDEKTKELVKNIDDLDFIICNSETDALILENNLIKKYSPKYNINLKDEKTYPYILVTKEDFPKISIIRTTKKLNLSLGYYFGPFPQGAWNLKKILTKIYKFRDCNRDMSKTYSRPCLKYHMGLCKGPCINKSLSYEQELNDTLEILKGNTKEIITSLNKQMIESAENMEFEKAIILREQKQEIENNIHGQISEYGKDIDEDIFTFSHTKNKVFICVLNVRAGKILGKTFLFIDLKDIIYSDIFQETMLRYYSKFPLPKNIILQNEFQSYHENLITLFEQVFNKKINLFFPKIKSRRLELLEMGLNNLEKDIENFYNKQNIVEQGLKDLYYNLELNRFPLKIECFDISNIQGKDAVASMSVSVEGRKSTKDYRKFKIQCKDTPDDFQMMREVIERRYGKLDPIDFPDAILIDGGLGQINAVGQILENLGKDNIADLISIAKREEEIFKYGNPLPYIFSKSDEALKILQRVRDEAHRFGVTYHRKLRSKRVISSELDKIPGIGIKRRELLLKTFGSVARIKNTSVEELSKTIPNWLAKKIKEMI